VASFIYLFIFLLFFLYVKQAKGTRGAKKIKNIIASQKNILITLFYHGTHKSNSNTV
jgi:hypothetical protein